MFKSICSLLVLATMLTSCATQQPLTGNGKFLQMIAGDELLLQINFNSAESCERNGKQIKNTNEMLKIMCSTESREIGLPFSFVATDTVTNLKETIHARTLEGCRETANILKADNKKARYEYTECM